MQEKVEKVKEAKKEREIDACPGCGIMSFPSVFKQQPKTVTPDTKNSSATAASNYETPPVDDAMIRLHSAHK